jgi:uncharacterized protein (DUF305 family)
MKPCLRMPPPRIRRILGSLVAALVTADCGGSAPVGVPPASGPAPSAQGNSAAIARARADSLRYPYTEADIRFMSGMIGHHAQAIQMAGWAPSHEAGPSVRILASRIINAQEDEIATMQRWLSDRRQPVPEVTPKGLKMMMDGAEHVMLMPGMLTEAQLAQLDQARGAEFDRLFLTFMIQHHKGAVTMVSTLFDTYGAGQDETVFKFASDVNVDQSTEIDRMEKMLAALRSRPQERKP